MSSMNAHSLAHTEMGRSLSSSQAGRFTQAVTTRPVGPGHRDGPNSVNDTKGNNLYRGRDNLHPHHLPALNPPLPSTGNGHSTSCKQEIPSPSCSMSFTGIMSGIGLLQSA